MNQVRFRFHTQALQPICEDALTVAIDTAYQWRQYSPSSSGSTSHTTATIQGICLRGLTPTDHLVRVTTPRQDTWCKVHQWKIQDRERIHLILTPLHPETQAICHAITGANNG